MIDGDISKVSQDTQVVKRLERWGVKVEAYISEERLTDFKLHPNASWPVLFNLVPDRPFKSCIVCGQVKVRLGPRLIRNSSLLFRVTLRQGQSALG